MFSVDTIAAFESIILALDTLCLHVHDDLQRYPVFVDNGAGMLVPDKDKIIYALKYLQFVENQTPQETYSCVGVVGGTEETLRLVEAVNRAKDNFKTAVAAYMAVGERTLADVRRLLALNDYPDIKLKHVYRHLHAIDYHPRRISFTRDSHSFHRVISPQEAKQRLLETGQGLNIDIQLTKLSLLKDSDKLAIQRKSGSFWAANIATFKNAEGRSTTHKTVTSLPLFYLHDNSKLEPIVCFSKSINKPMRKANKRIEDQPFLPSISAYRYKKP